MLDVLLNTLTQMSRIKPADFHGFTESIEFLFIELNRSCRRARIMTPLDDQHRGLDAFSVGDQ